jgi:hypothetical protein
MASTYSDSLKLELMETGANAATWGTNTNTNLEVLDAFTQGYVSKSVAGSANITLSTGNADPNAEAANKVIELTGALTGDIVVFIPAVTGGSEYLFFNNTSGSQTLTIAATGHTANGAIITQGAYSRIYCDGTANFNVKIQTSLLGAVTTKGAVNFNAGATVTAGQDLTAGSGNIIARSNGQVQATLFTGSGAGLTGVDPFPSGTKMVFYQASAPTGWTQDTAAALANTAMSIVTGSGGGTGGATSFYDVFNGTTKPVDTGSLTVSVSASIGAHTLSTPEIPSHNHSIKIGNRSPSGSAYPSGLLTMPPSVPIDIANGSDQKGPQVTSPNSVQSTGGGGSHTHPFSVSSSSLGGTASTPALNVKYANVIIAAKDS